MERDRIAPIIRRTGTAAVGALTALTLLADRAGAYPQRCDVNYQATRLPATLSSVTAIVSEAGGREIRRQTVRSGEIISFDAPSTNGSDYSGVVVSYAEGASRTAVLSGPCNMSGSREVFPWANDTVTAPGTGGAPRPAGEVVVRIPNPLDVTLGTVLRNGWAVAALMAITWWYRGRYFGTGPIRRFLHPANVRGENHDTVDIVRREEVDISQAAAAPRTGPANGQVVRL